MQEFPAICATGETVTTLHAFKVHTDLRRQLKMFLTDPPPAPWADSSAVLVADERPPTVESLERRAALQWNRVLHFLVGTEEASTPSPPVLRLLLSSGLLAPDDKAGRRQIRHDDAAAAGIIGGRAGSAAKENGSAGSGRTSASAATDDHDDDVTDGEPAGTEADGLLDRAIRAKRVKLTRSGYQFMMQPTEHQLWIFLHNYAASAGQRGGRPSDVIRLLLRLGCVPLSPPWQCHMALTLCVSLWCLQTLSLGCPRANRRTRGLTSGPVVRPRVDRFGMSPWTYSCSLCNGSWHCRSVLRDIPCVGSVGTRVGGSFAPRSRCTSRCVNCCIAITSHIDETSAHCR